MTLRRKELLSILRIGHDTSFRGKGISLHQALSEANYTAVRGQLAASDLGPLIRARPKFIKQWLMYSADKRTNGGWYVTDTGDVGQVTEPYETMRFESLEEAVAEYVLRELDYWAAV